MHCVICVASHKQLCAYWKWPPWVSLCFCAEDGPSAPGPVLLRWWRVESGGHRAGWPRRQEGPSEMYPAGQPVPILSGQEGDSDTHKVIIYVLVYLNYCWYLIHSLWMLHENRTLSGVEFFLSILTNNRCLPNALSVEVMVDQIHSPWFVYFIWSYYVLSFQLNFGLFDSKPQMPQSLLFIHIITWVDLGLAWKLKIDNNLISPFWTKDWWYDCCLTNIAWPSSDIKQLCW